MGQAVEAALDRIDSASPSLGAVVAVDPDRSRDEASKVPSNAPLAGVAMLVKDLESVVGWPTSNGLGKSFAVEAAADSTMVARLRHAGVVVVGVSNTSPFGYASITDGAAFGPARNPHDLTRTAGGSSGGAAAAVAAGLVPLATGSDGGGSLRIPASACGIPGVALTRGRVPGGPQSGVWWELSTPGVLTSNIDDLALALDQIVGPDLGDPRSLAPLAPQWATKAVANARPMRVGWSSDLGFAPTDPEVLQVVADSLKQLEAAGCTIVDLPPILDDDPVVVWWHLASPYIWAATKHLYDTDAWSTLPADLVEQAEYGRTQPAEEFFEARTNANELSRRVHEIYDQHEIDVIATPTCAALPPILGRPATVAGLEDPNWVRFTYLTNLTNQPAASIPAGAFDGCPVGLQLIAPRGHDELLLSSAAFAERNIAKAIAS